MKKILQLNLALVLALMAGTAQAESAHLTLVLFMHGEPLPDVRIAVDGESEAHSNALGRAKMHLPAGTHRLQFFSQTDALYTHELQLHDGEIAQLLLDFRSDAPPALAYESSVDPDAVLGNQASTAATAEAQVQTTLQGQVINLEDEQPVAGARVFIGGVSGHLISDSDGRFSLTLPVGSYNVSVMHARFNSRIQSDVALTADGDNSLRVELTPAGSEMPEFVVIEPHIEGSLASVLEERRNNNSVANYLSMEQIGKAGDSDAAGALKRVTGLTLVDGKFIFIRGLGERYSSTLLNGANLPSPDPTRRVVPLDLFPTGLIESIEVQKGYSAGLPAEFGGGTVVLKTVSVPEENFFKLGLSYQHNTQTTGKDGLGYRGGGRDWTGFDDGTRDIPDALLAAIAGDTELRPNNPFFDGGFSPEELELLGESLAPVYTISSESLDPGSGFDVSGGMRHTTEAGPVLGFSAALEYGNEYQTRSELRRDFIVATGSTLSLDSEELSTTSKRDITLSGFLTTGVEFNDQHEVSLNYMVLRSTQDFAEIAEGFNEDLGNARRIHEIRWTERELAGLQLFGEHSYPALGGLRLNWHFADSEAQFDEPDNRVYRYDQREEGDFVFSTRNDSNSRVFRTLSDQSRNLFYDLDFPFTVAQHHDFLINFGQNWVNKDRDSDIRRFVFEDVGSLVNDVDRGDPLEDILNPDFIAPNGFQLIEVTRATDNYFANLDIKGTYLSIDYAYKERLRVSLGARRENFSQAVTTFRLFDPDQSPVTARLDDEGLFPALSATWLLPNDHQLRFNYSETATRPDFKELSPAQFKDPVLDRNVIGNPDLTTGSIKHYDLRWDKYFSAGEFVSVSLFYKQFIQPIEIVILPGSSRIISFDNAESAENAGIELEVYKDLSFIHSRLQNYYVSANYAYIDSEIVLDANSPGGQTSSTRPLQGQSPYVANLQIGYDDTERDLSAALLFNVFGERISEAGTSGRPDIYEQPFEQLDFIYSQRLAEHWKLSLKLKNLLNDEVLFLQGDEITRQFTRGRSLSLGVSLKF